MAPGIYSVENTIRWIASGWIEVFETSYADEVYTCEAFLTRVDNLLTVTLVNAEVLAPHKLCITEHGLSCSWIMWGEDLLIVQ